MSPLRRLPEIVQMVREQGIMREVEPGELEQMMHSGQIDLLIDVRETEEQDVSALEGAILLPRGILERDLETRVFGGAISESDLERPIALYCRGGQRSMLAGERMHQMGFTNIISMHGGFRQWCEQGRPVVVKQTAAKD